MFEKKIRKSSYGDYVVEFGKTINPVKCEYKPGYYMPAFIVYQSSRYDTLEEAQKATYNN